MARGMGLFVFFSVDILFGRMRSCNELNAARAGFILAMIDLDLFTCAFSLSGARFFYSWTWFCDGEETEVWSLLRCYTLKMTIAN